MSDKNVTVKAAGGREMKFSASEVETVQGAYNKLSLDGNYTAMINGEPANMSDEISAYDWVEFTESVKGGVVA